MFELFAKAFVYVFEAYAIVGALFAAVFVSIGVQKLDSEGQGSGIAFRLLILPGATVFWPMLLTRWIHGVIEPPMERNPHRIAK